jgi:hypothetical protein
LRSDVLCADKLQRSSGGRGPFSHRVQSEVTGPVYFRVEAAAVIRDQKHDLVTYHLKHNIDASCRGVLDDVVQRLTADHQ